MQDNKKIVDALKSWVEPIEGWFWDIGKVDAFKGELCWTEGLGVTRRFGEGNSGEFDYNNFSLTNPNKKKLISTVDEARAWASANSYTLVRTRYGVDVASETDFKEFYSITAQTGLKPSGSPVWTPITEIEAV